MMLQKMTALILSMLILAACMPIPETTAPVDIGPDISMQKDEHSPVTLTWFLCSFEDTLGAGLGKASGEDPVIEVIRQETGVTLQLVENAMDLLIWLRILPWSVTLALRLSKMQYFCIIPLWMQHGRRMEATWRKGRVLLN